MLSGRSMFIWKLKPVLFVEIVSSLREALEGMGKELAICSHDIPSNLPQFPFQAFARHAHINAPQVYYGGSPSVENRLQRAIDANASVDLPFVPVGAAWIGDGGGCATASACAWRARTFIRLAQEHAFPGYSFWHWMGARAKVWEVLFAEPA